MAASFSFDTGRTRLVSASLTSAENTHVFRYLVLGLLRNGGSFHGYALMKEYRDRSGLQLSTGNFYRELQRLVAEDLVRTVANPADADPRRAPYEITDTGAVAFDTWLASPPGQGFGRYEDELSARALFLATAEPAVARSLLESWREELWIRSKVHERARAASRAHAAQHDPAFSPLPLLLNRNLQHIAADLQFLDELAQAYEQWLQTATPMIRRRPILTRTAPSRRLRRREDAN